MTVSIDGNVVRLEGDCPVEDAEALLTLLQSDAKRPVDVTVAGHLHTAVIQILLALRPQLIGPAGDSFVRTWIAPILTRAPAVELGSARPVEE